MLGALCLRCHLESPEETTAVCSRVKSTGMTFKVMATRCLGVEAGRPRPWHCSCEARKRGEARRVRGEGGVHMPTPGLECVCVDGWVGCPDPKEDEGPGQPDPLLWSRGDKRPLEGCFSAHRAPARGSILDSWKGLCLQGWPLTGIWELRLQEGSRRSLTDKGDSLSLNPLHKR